MSPVGTSGTLLYEQWKRRGCFEIEPITTKITNLSKKSKIYIIDIIFKLKTTY